MHSTHQRPPRWNTHRASAVSAPKSNAIRRDGVHIRRLQTRMTIHAQAIAALLIGHDEKDIGLLVHGNTSLLLLSQYVKVKVLLGYRLHLL
jgi:hypothetical protein